MNGNLIVMCYNYHMARHFTEKFIFELTDQDKEKLSRIAAKRRISKACLLRQLIDALVEE